MGPPTSQLRMPIEKCGILGCCHLSILGTEYARGEFPLELSPCLGIPGVFRKRQIPKLPYPNSRKDQYGDGPGMCILIDHPDDSCADFFFPQMGLSNHFAVRKELSF